MAFKKVGNTDVEPHIVDGNYVIASEHPRPWIKQLNLLAAYTYFFNPVRMLVALMWSKSNVPFPGIDNWPLEKIQRYSYARKIRRRIRLRARTHLIDAGVQMIGMCGLFHTYRRTAGWAWRLYWGKIERCDQAPVSQIPMRGVDGKPALHGLPGQPLSKGPAPKPASRERASARQNR